MARIKGFRGVRYTPKAGNIADLVCPPYDIVNKEQRASLVERSQYNLIQLELPKGDDCYAKANELYRQWLADGILEQDKEDSVYIYEMKFSVKDESYSVKGVICAVGLEEFENGVILPHENTLSKAKTDRLDLLSATSASFSQIYSLYIDEKKTIHALIEQASAGAPDVDFTDNDGVTHCLWLVSDKEIIDALSSDFADRQLFIADGHHRYETALNYRNKLKKQNSDFSAEHPANYTCMFLVDMESDGLVIFPTHRMVANYGTFDESEVLDGINKNFSFECRKDLDNIEQVLADGLDEHTIALYTGKDYYYLLGYHDEGQLGSILPEMSDAFRELDVTVLHTLILEGVMGITKADQAKQTKLTYTRNIEEAISAVKKGKYSCSFLLNPTRIGQIKDVAKAGEKMPQKATYFYPKIITGMVFIKFD